MKKFFTFFVAAIAAMAINATELTLDLATAEQYAQTGDAQVSANNDMLEVDWNVTAAWSVAGAAFPLDNLTNVTKILFEYTGDGASEAEMIACLEDANGNRLWDDEVGTLPLSVTDWSSIELVPSASLWSDLSEGPWVKLVFMANPASPSQGVFYLRNVKIEYAENPEWVIFGVNVPVNGKPESIELFGAFGDPIALEENAETHWYLNYDVNVAASAEFSIRAAGEEQNEIYVLNGTEWELATFKFGELWKDDTWKGDPCKMIELDLTGANYAWSVAIPEGITNTTVEAAIVKTIENGQLVIIKNGVRYNAQGTVVK